MKAYLMFPNRDVMPDSPAPAGASDLIDDLGLEAIVAAMARGDRFLAEVAMAALLNSLASPSDIGYRQAVLRDSRANEAVVRQLYALAVEAIQKQRTIFGWLSGRYPAAILSHAIEVMELFAQLLRRLRQVADEHAGDFRSPGFRRFFQMLEAELDDGYFREIDAHLRRLRLKGGVLISAQLGPGGKGVDLVLRRPVTDRPTLGDRLAAFAHPAPSFRIAERDETGANALGELRGRGVNLVADALARSTDHILGFFRMLRTELGFYVGCLNLAGTLAAAGYPAGMPEALAPPSAAFSCSGLYDAALALLADTQVVGNDVATDELGLVVVTGANRGGKSTFLRSVGQAQLMMQAGMFVAADSFSAAVRTGVFTHFSREEDATMTSGKLDEELARMSGIADAVRPAGLVLLNESFASTNEREGSEIGRQVVRALRQCGVVVFLVTHQYDLSHGFAREGGHATLFLRAERERTFSLAVGEPLPTSFGGDLYRRVFGVDPVAGARPSATS